MNSRRRDEQETLNAVEVIKWIEHLILEPTIPITVDLICHINYLILRNTDRDYWAGRIRSEVDWQHPEDWTRRRAIVALEEPGLAVADERTGELLVSFPPDQEVGPMIDDLMAWINLPEDVIDPPIFRNPVIRAAVFHQQFTAIHPFRDGNGRTARALTSLLLLRAGFPVRILHLQRVLDERRDMYIASLRAADRGNKQGWIEFFAQAVAEALEI